MASRFEWDPVKAESNLRKHGVSFETATIGLNDPFALTEIDRNETSEVRWRTFGHPNANLIVVVIRTSRESMKMGKLSKSSASSPRASRTGRKHAATSENLVRYEFDPANPPPLTDAQKEELAALARRTDDDIDYTDIPPTSDDFWQNAVRGKFYRPTKTSTTVRIDSDVLAWLRGQGKGYQSRLNAILRREMLAALKR